MLAGEVICEYTAAELLFVLWWCNWGLVCNVKCQGGVFYRVDG